MSQSGIRLKKVATPGMPPADWAEIYYETGAPVGIVKVRKEDGTIVDLEAQGAGGGTDFTGISVKPQGGNDDNHSIRIWTTGSSSRILIRPQTVDFTGESGVIEWYDTDGSTIRNYLYQSTGFLSGATFKPLIVRNGLHVNAALGAADSLFSGDTLTNLLYIAAALDRLGIGTNAPARLVEIQGAGGTNPLLRIASTGASASERYIELGGTAGLAGGFGWLVAGDEASTGDLYFRVMNGAGPPGTIFMRMARSGLRMGLFGDVGAQNGLTINTGRTDMFQGLTVNTGRGGDGTVDALTVLADVAGVSELLIADPQKDSVLIHGTKPEFSRLNIQAHQGAGGVGDNNLATVHLESGSTYTAATHLFMYVGPTNPTGHDPGNGVFGWRFEEDRNINGDFRIATLNNGTLARRWNFERATGYLRLLNRLTIGADDTPARTLDVRGDAVHSGFIDILETSTPANPGAFTRRLYVDSGTGQTTVRTSGGVTVSLETTDTTQIIDNAVTDAKLRDSAATSVIGRSAGTSGDPADIASSADGQVLRRAGGTLGFGALDLSDSDAVTGTLPSGNLPAAVVLDTDANTYTAGAKQSFTHSATTAGLRIVGASGDPSSPADGDIWYNTTTNKYRKRQNGVTEDMDTTSAGGGGTLDQAYDTGGAGAGRTINADTGAVQILGINADGDDLLMVDHTFSGTATADTADTAVLRESRTHTGATTVTDDHDLVTLKRTSVTNNASANLTANGAVLKLETVATQTLGTLADNTHLIEVVMDPDGVGHLLDGRQTGDSDARVQLTKAGAINFGPGNAALDVTLQRGAANRLETASGDSIVAGGTLGIKNATSFTTTLTSTPTADRSHTVPNVADDTFTMNAAAQTLTSKTLTTPTIGDFTNATHNHQAAAGGGTLDHGLALTGLTDDDHTQYGLLAGRSGGQTLKGDTLTGGNLTLESTNHATKGEVRSLDTLALRGGSNLRLYDDDNTQRVDIAVPSNVTADRVHTVPDVADDTFVMLAATQTLTGKTLTTPTISGSTLTGVHDGGGATSVEIPNGAGGTTLDAAGEVCVDTTSKTFNFYSDAEYRLNPIQTKSISVEDPTNAEDITIFYANSAVTIKEIRAVLLGSATPSVTWTIRHSATDRSAAGTEAVTSGTTTTSTTTGSDVTSFNDATATAGWVWLETTAKSGTVDELHVTIYFVEDP